MSWASDEFPRIRARLMAAAMQPIERQDVTVEELESWFDDELACESSHEDFRNRVCSGEVTHRDFPCNPPSSRAVCERQAAWIMSWVDSDIPCGDCGEPCSTHWRVVSI